MKKIYLIPIILIAILLFPGCNDNVQIDRDGTQYLPSLLTALHLEPKNSVLKTLEYEKFKIVIDDFGGFDAYSKDMITDTINKYKVWGDFEKNRYEYACGSQYISDRSKVIELSQEWRYYFEKMFPSPDLWIGAIRIGNATKLYYSGKLLNKYKFMLESIKDEPDAYNYFSQIIKNGGESEYQSALKSINFELDYRGLAEYYIIGKDIEKEHYNCYCISYGNLNNATFYIEDTTNPDNLIVLFDYNLLCLNYTKDQSYAVFGTTDYFLEDFIDVYKNLQSVAQRLGY